MSRVSEELSKYFHEQRIKQIEIARDTGAHPTTISNVLAGRSNVSPALAYAMHEKYGFNVRFLLYGEGELFPPKPTDSGDRIFSGSATGSNINMGDHVNMGVDAERAALLAQIQALKDENRWLREVVAGKADK